eukprot:151880-Pyramimonas_sp.AAC.1
MSAHSSHRFVGSSADGPSGAARMCPRHSCRRIPHTLRGLTGRPTEHDFHTCDTYNCRGSVLSPC